MNRNIYLTGLVAAALAVATSAQLPDLIITESGGSSCGNQRPEALYRLTDNDSNDDYLSDSNEVVLLLYGADNVGTAACPVGSDVNGYELGIVNFSQTATTTEGGNEVMYALAEGPGPDADGVFRCEDIDGSGRFEEWEVTNIHDEDSTPQGLAIAGDGAVWWVSRGDAEKGVWRVTPAGAAVKMVEAGAGGGFASWNAEVDGGTELINASNFQNMAPAGNGAITYCGFSSSSAFHPMAIFRFEDKTSDGDVADAGESRLFLNYVDKTLDGGVDLPISPDFDQSGTPDHVSPEISVPSAGWDRMLQLASDGTTNFWFCSDANSGSPNFSQNVNGDWLNGRIYLGVDGNADDDINDDDETTLFYDGSGTGAPTTSVGVTTGGLHKVLGMSYSSHDGWLYVMHLSPDLRVARFKDGNADGDAMDAGESDFGPSDAGLFNLSTWGQSTAPLPPGGGAGIFGLNMSVGSANGAMGESNNKALFSGTGCAQYNSHTELPQISGFGRLTIGTSDHKATVGNALPGSTVLLMVGLSTTSWLGQPLPFDVGLLGYPGCTLYQNITFQKPSQTVLADGTRQRAVKVKNDPSLDGVEVGLQWLALDFLSGGIGLSNLSKVTIEL